MYREELLVLRTPPGPRRHLALASLRPPPLPPSALRPLALASLRPLALAARRPSGQVLPRDGADADIHLTAGGSLATLPRDRSLSFP